jgi:hypothetical protein
VAQEVGVDTLGIETRLLGQPADDQEGARTGQRAAARVEEELWPEATVEVGPSSGQVPPERLGGRAADRDDPLLVPLADAPDESLFEVDRSPLEPDRLAHP